MLPDIAGALPTLQADDAVLELDELNGERHGIEA
jgi:hypothetical protein